MIPSKTHKDIRYQSDKGLTNLHLMGVGGHEEMFKVILTENFFFAYFLFIKKRCLNFIDC